MTIWSPGTPVFTEILRCLFPSRPSLTMSPSQKIGNFMILAKLGEGAESHIYAVQDSKTKQVWALKHVVREVDKDARFIEQVEREYEIGSKFDHPSLRTMVKLIRHRRMFKTHSVSLIMELVDAVTLDQRLPTSQAESVDIFRRVAEGLLHMHGRGYVHADIKPTNILIMEDGGVKIIDLGQACLIGTVKKRIQGTPGYMAPEQAHRQAITPKTDIYNLGAMMYWVLAHEVIPTVMPPKGRESAIFTGALDTGEIKPPVPPHVRNPRIHPLLSRQIMDCVQMDPNDRPASMEVIVNRLELIKDVLENPADPAPEIVGDEDTRD
jgi:serine/threonine protein kinase